MHAAARTNRRALSVPGRQGSTTPPQREQGCGERGRAENVPIAAGRLPRSGVMRRAHGGRPGAGTTGTAPKRTTASRCELANRQAFRGRTATRVNPSPRASGATVDRSAVGPFGLGPSTLLLDAAASSISVKQSVYTLCTVSSGARAYTSVRSRSVLIARSLKPHYRTSCLYFPDESPRRPVRLWVSLTRFFECVSSQSVNQSFISRFRPALTKGAHPSAPPALGSPSGSAPPPLPV